MPDDELDQVIAPPDDTPPDDTPQMTYEDMGDGKYKWEDGVVTDVDGNEIDETPALTPAPTPQPTARVEQPKPVQQVQQPRTATEQRQIYTLDGLEQSIYTDAALNEIADVQLMDPLKAERMRAQLARTYNQRAKQLEQYAGDMFEQELADLERDAPQTVQLYGRSIQRQKARMSPEELQTPGMARRAIAQAHTEYLYGADALTIEEDVVRSRQLNPAALKLPPTPPAPTQRRIIPPAAREPGPGGSAPQHARTTRKPGSSTRSELFQARRQMYAKDLYPDVTDEEIQAWCDEMEQQDKLRRRVTHR